MKKIFLFCFFLAISTVVFAKQYEGVYNKVYKTDENGVVGWRDDASGQASYPTAGIAVSTGTAWGTSLTDNHSNWDTAYGWGNHASQNYFDKDTDTLDAIPDGTTYKLISNTNKTHYDTAYTHSQAAHAPSNAQANADITKAEIEAKLTGVISSHSHSGGGLGYARELVSASQSTTTDSQTMYWGGMAVAPSTTAARWRIYIPKAGTIKAVYIYSYSGTAGSNENWSMYVRLNNTSDTLIQTLAANTNDRVWSNTGLNISVAVGDYIEIKEVQPAWGTNPATVTRNGIIYIE